MRRKFLFISEALSVPFDEGIKNVAFSLYRQLEMKRNVLAITNVENSTDNLKISKIKLNKLFLNNRLRKLIRNYSPDVILYLPEASITFNSFLRAKILKLMNRLSKVIILAVQRRGYPSIQWGIIANFLRPDLLLLMGEFGQDFFLKKGLNLKVLPPAVDNVKFSPATKDEKEKIRAEYNIPLDKKVVLHIGHIRPTRNVDSLLEVQKLKDIQVVIVGSTSTPVYDNLKAKLVKNGVKIIDKFIPDISKIYKMSDIYVFPVVKSYAAIEIPLSILEALACNLPVITTRFGGLINYFKEDTGFRYFDTTEELVELVRRMGVTNLHNNKKIESFTWDRFADEIMTACNELI